VASASGAPRADIRYRPGDIPIAAAWWACYDTGHEPGAPIAPPLGRIERPSVAAEVSV
jgi:hypothetical protein